MKKKLDSRLVRPGSATSTNAKSRVSVCPLSQRCLCLCLGRCLNQRSEAATATTTTTGATGKATAPTSLPASTSLRCRLFIFNTRAVTTKKNDRALAAAATSALPCLCLGCLQLDASPPPPSAHPMPLRALAVNLIFLRREHSGAAKTNNEKQRKCAGQTESKAPKTHNNNNNNNCNSYIRVQ